MNVINMIQISSQNQKELNKIIVKKLQPYKNIVKDTLAAKENNIIGSSLKNQ